MVQRNKNLKGFRDVARNLCLVQEPRTPKYYLNQSIFFFMKTRLVDRKLVMT